jgi:hypothetical protein
VYLESNHYFFICGNIDANGAANQQREEPRVSSRERPSAAAA